MYGCEAETRETKIERCDVRFAATTVVPAWIVQRTTQAFIYAAQNK